MLLLALLAASPADAQRFGRWWWDASLGVAEDHYETRIDGVDLETRGESNLRLALGVNGYVRHPAIARFRLGLDTELTSTENGRTLDSERIGYDGLIELFPQGVYPSRIFFRRSRFDYRNLTAANAVGLLAIPDLATSYGARLRVRRGPLRGTLFGVEHSTLEFLDREVEDRVESRQFLDWSGSGDRLRRHLRLERDFRDFGAADYEIENLILNVGQHGEVRPDWHWNLTGIGLRRNVLVGEAAEIAIDSLRVTTSLLHRSSEERGDLLALTYTGGLVAANAGSTSQSHAVSGRYLWRRWNRWELTPFARFGYQTSERQDLVAPQIGLSANWQRSGRRAELSVTPSVSYLLIERSGAAGSGTDSNLAYGLNAAISRGSEERLRQELEVSFARNELRVAGDLITDLPDLGVGLVGTGTEDQLRGRLTLSRRWGGLLASIFGEWSQREASSERREQPFRLESETLNLQLSGGRFQFLATAGETSIELAEGAQTLSFASGTVSLRPWRRLSLRASYRVDERQVFLAPNVDGERAELGLTLRFGAFHLQAEAFESEEQLLLFTDLRMRMADRSDSGYRLTLSRNFAGWLPVVTGTQRRGVIR